MVIFFVEKIVISSIIFNILKIDEKKLTRNIFFVVINYRACLDQCPSFKLKRINYVYVYTHGLLDTITRLSTTPITHRGLKRRHNNYKTLSYSFV